jgi:glutathione S-transferase
MHFFGVQSSFYSAINRVYFFGVPHKTLMLKLKPNCECCDKDLLPISREAYVCSFEHTFCTDCANQVFHLVCPNCAGDLVRRPTRSAAKLVGNPAQRERTIVNTAPHSVRHKPMRIYSGPLSMFGAKVEIAAREKAVSFEIIHVPFNPSDGYSPKHPDVIRINPKSQVPVLIDGDLEIFDSTQIFEYLEDVVPTPALWPAQPRQRARARLLELKSDEVYFGHVIKLMSLQDALESTEGLRHIEACSMFYHEMEIQLGEQPFLAGELSFADIGFLMAQFFSERMGAPMDSSTPGLCAWRIRMHKRDAVRATIEPMIAFLRANGSPCPDFLIPLYG